MPIAIIAGISGVLGAGASIFGASQQSSAARHAADLQMQQYQQTRKDLQPFMTAGAEALPGINEILASLKGGFNPSDLAQTPGYQFDLQQGEQAINDQATTGVGGGNTLKELMKFGTGLADKTFEQRFQDWLLTKTATLGGYENLASLGENAAASAGNAGASAANNAGNYLTQGASARSAGLTGAANSLIGGANQIGSNYLLASLLNGQGGGFGNSSGFGDSIGPAIADPGGMGVFG